MPCGATLPPRRPRMEDDCLAARVAAAFGRRFGDRASLFAHRRLSRAIRRRDTVKTDLFCAVTVILADPDRVFSRSRA